MDVTTEIRNKAKYLSESEFVIWYDENVLKLKKEGRRFEKRYNKETATLNTLLDYVEKYHDAMYVEFPPKLDKEGMFLLNYEKKGYRKAIRHIGYYIKNLSK